MTPPREQQSFFYFVDSAVRLAKATEADAILIIVERPCKWARLKKKTAGVGQLILATHSEELKEKAEKAELTVTFLDKTAATVQNQITQAVLANVAEETLRPGSTVVAVYSGFDDDSIDSISVMQLTERLGRLTARDLRKLKTKVPLETLKTVVDLAVEIGREGREGKPVGTMFVVGDHRKVLEQSREGGFDMTRGYKRSERNISDYRVREGMKEIAQIDGMTVISSDGTIEGTARIIDTSPVQITMTTGLGSRHFAGAAISKNTKAIAVVVSQSSGTVRIFQNGEVVLRIEPMQRAMKWRDFDNEPGQAPDSGKSTP